MGSPNKANSQTDHGFESERTCVVHWRSRQMFDGTNSLLAKSVHTFMMPAWEHPEVNTTLTRKCLGRYRLCVSANMVEQ